MQVENPAFNHTQFKMDTSVSCSLCTKEFSSKRALSYHNSRFHTPATCSTCNKEFENARLLDVHERKQHITAGESVDNKNFSDATKSDSDDSTASSIETFNDSVSESEKSVTTDVESEGNLSSVKDEDSSSSDNSSSSSKRQIERPTKRNSKQKKIKYDREGDFLEFRRSNLNKRDPKYKPLTAAYKFKDVFKIPNSKESLALKSSEISLIDSIMSTESLREVSDILEENPRDVQSIYHQIERLIGKE